MGRIHEYKLAPRGCLFWDYFGDHTDEYLRDIYRQFMRQSNPTSNWRMVDQSLSRLGKELLVDGKP